MIKTMQTLTFKMDVKEAADKNDISDLSYKIQNTDAPKFISETSSPLYIY